MINPFRFLGGGVYAALWLGAVVTATASVSDVQSFLVAKGQQFHQTNAAAPALEGSSGAYRFYSMVDAAYSNSIVSASLQLPGTAAKALTNTGNAFELEQAFSTKALLDAAARPGRYQFTIQTAQDGTRTPALVLPADAYPPTPHVANWLEAQQVEAGLPLTLRWDPFTNGTAADFVLLEVAELDGTPVLSSPGMQEPGALNGTNRFALIDAGSLQTNHSYEARLLFLKRTGLNDTNYPGAVGESGYYKQTEFSLQTLDEPPASGRLQFFTSQYVVDEDGGSVLVTVQRAGSQGTVSVQLDTADGSAHGGPDFQTTTSILTFPDGVTSASVSIPVFDDYLLEGNESFNVVLQSPTGGAVLGNRTNAVVTIVDNEKATAGAFQFISSAVTVSESGRYATVLVGRVGGKTGEATVHFQTQNGSAVGGTDFAPTNTTLRFANGQSSVIVPIRITDDSLVKSNQNFIVVLDSPTGGAALGTNRIARVNISENDRGGVISFSSSTYTTNENAGFALIRVNRTGGLAAGVTVHYATEDGTAVAGQDYYATNGMVTFGANELTQTIVLPIKNDLVAEGDETVQLHLTSPGGGATLGTISNAVLRILDDESSVGFTNATYSVTESGPVITLNVIRSGAKTTSVSVDFATVNGTAIAPGDFRENHGTLVFPPNVTLKTITIPIVNDTLAEGNEKFRVVLSNPQGGTQLGAISNTEVTIVENDTAGTIQFSAASYSATESAGKAVVTITRTGGTASGVSVVFTTVPGTALPGSDYTAVATNLTFAAGETTKTVTIPILADSTKELTETVSLVLVNPTSGAVLGSPSLAVLNISDAPDPNAVPVTGAPFFKMNLNGAARFSAFTVNAVFQTNVLSGQLQLANLVATSGASFPMKLFQMTAYPGTPGVVQYDNSGTHGIVNYSETTLAGAKTWGVASGSDSVGSGGTLTIDGLDFATKTISGRFTFQARETTGNVSGSLVTLTGSFRAHWLN